VPVPPRLRDNGDALDALLARAAEALDRPLSFLEKDFWAIEVLRVVSTDRQINLRDGASGTVRTVFKGGTSLSRVYGLIDRFSEDIDVLVIFPDYGGGPSENMRDRLLKSIAGEVLAHIGLLSDQVELLGSSKGVARKLKYHYSLRTAADSALTEGVTLEMGSRGGPEPMERHSLRSIVADYATGALGEPEDQWEEFASFGVNVLGAERTLFEKLSAVHSITSDPSSMQSAPAGWGRHFHDIDMLLQSEMVRTKLVEMGGDGVKQLVLDIENRSAAAGWRFVTRPLDGYASSPAFDSGAPVAAAVRRAYEAVEGLMYGPVVPLEESLASVRHWAELL
jgi:nucleotidyltransferase AbiEii toxin of type IV toxin-antitoxin system